MNSNPNQRHKPALTQAGECKAFIVTGGSTTPSRQPPVKNAAAYTSRVKTQVSSSIKFRLGHKAPVSKPVPSDTTPHALPSTEAPSSSAVNVANVFMLSSAAAKALVDKFGGT